MNHQSRRSSKIYDHGTRARINPALGSMVITGVDESFYASMGRLVENMNVRGSMRTETLGQARSWHGLE